MSVYTEVPAEELQDFLDDYDIGRLLTFTGICEGIENTNYFVTTASGEYVLTLFEHTAPTEIEPALRLMAYLDQCSLPCPLPVADRQGRVLGQLMGKPAGLVSRLRGRSALHPGPEHCHSVGHSLARLHLATATYESPHPNPRGADWRQSVAAQIRGRLDPGQKQLLADELRYQQIDFADLPRGMIHADLFRDNVLFSGTQLTGLLDLYHCGEDLLLYDLAIAATDWCSLPAGDFDLPRLQALLTGYAEQRSVGPAEQACWPDLLRRAALRFWLSRLYKHYHPRPGRLTQSKDPGIYRQLLENYRRNPPRWPI